MQKHLLFFLLNINNLTQINVIINTSKKSLKSLHHNEENDPRNKGTTGDAVRAVCSGIIFFLLPYLFSPIPGCWCRLSYNVEQWNKKKPRLTRELFY